MRYWFNGFLFGGFLVFLSIALWNHFHGYRYMMLIPLGFATFIQSVYALESER